MSRVALKVLFIGGTGEISAACVQRAVLAGHQVTVFNRGRRGSIADENVETIIGDREDHQSYAKLANASYDVVCQFLAFQPKDVARDIELFAGRCGQYIFVSSASAYQKPNQTALVTERTPLVNPFMPYSRNKAACETLLADKAGVDYLPYTIVRPSHTYDKRLPSTLVDGDHLAWRLLAGKPVVVHDDGTSLWTLTRSEDFARAFVDLFGASNAIGQAFHITDSQAYDWNSIIGKVGELLGCEPTLVHVPTVQLVAEHEEWRGPLYGDKANSMVFDNQKIASISPGWQCRASLMDGLASALVHVKARLDDGYTPPTAMENLINRLVRTANAYPR